MSLFIGIDIGTSKISAVVIDSRSGAVQSAVSLPNDSRVVYRDKKRVSWTEQNPLRIKKQVFAGIRALVNSMKSSPSAIKGVAMTGQMHGMLLVDSRIEPLTNLITWQDKRCDSLFAKKHHSYIYEMINRAGGAGIFDSTGTFPSTGYAGATLFWLAQNRSLPKKTHRFAFIHDWLSALLSGNCRIYTDPTDAGSTGMFNIRNRKWYSTLIKKLGLPQKILPEVKESGAVIGAVSKTVAGQTGLPQNTPVHCAIGDNQAGMLAGIGNRKDLLFVNIGTGAQVSVLSDRFVKINGIDTRCYPANQYVLVGATLSGGQAYQLLENFFSDAGRAFWNIKKSPPLFARMNVLAEKPSALVCKPLFFGQRNNPAETGFFANINQHNFTTADFCRAVLEGIVEELYGYYTDIRRQIHCRHKAIVCSGSVIRQNPVLVKIIRCRFNLPVKLAIYDEEAAAGAASIACQK